MVCRVYQQIEIRLNKKAKKKFLPLQRGDIRTTLSDTSKLRKLTNYKPDTSISYGINKFIDWYLKYYNVKK